MPYPSNEDLPDGVKNALPSAAQSIWRNAFNSAFEKNKDEEGANKQAWGAVKNAGWKKQGDKWVKFEEETFEFGAEIFSVGKWNGDKYSENDLDDIVTHFNALKDSVKPPIKLGHTWKQGQPALGWVKDLKRNGNKLIATLAQVPKIVYDAIKAGRYKRVSSEIYWNFKDKTGKTFNYVLKAVALLGADIPAVDNLKDLEAYLMQSIHDGSFDRIASYEFEGVTDETGSIILKPLNKSKVSNNMSENEKKVYEDQIAAKEAALKDAESKVKEAEAKLKTYEENKAKELRAKHETEFKSFCEDLVKSGKLMPTDRDKYFSDMGNLYYDPDKGFMIPVEAFKAYTAGVEAFIEFDEKGVARKKEQQREKTYNTAADELADRAQEYAEKNKVSYAEASDAILRTDKELAERWKMGE